VQIRRRPGRQPNRLQVIPPVYVAVRFAHFGVAGVSETLEL